VTELDGRKVDEPARMDQVRQALLAVLNGGVARLPSAPASTQRPSFSTT